MPKAIAAIGADVGGTWIRLQALDRFGRPIRSLKQPAPSLQDLPSFLSRFLRRWKVRPAHLVVGSRGIWTQAARRAMRRKLISLADNVTVMSDVETAWLAAFGVPPFGKGRRRRDFATTNPPPSPFSKGGGFHGLGQGILVISGTGSIAFGRDSNGHSARAGGLGPWIGDEGSAFWIGKQWLERCRGAQSTNVRRTAALTRAVIQKARRGNRMAKAIIMEAQGHLADLVGDLSKRLHWKGRIPVSWSGAVLDNDWFRRGFTALVRERQGNRFKFVKRQTDPATAVARYVLNHAHH